MTERERERDYECWFKFRLRNFFVLSKSISVEVGKFYK